MGLKKLIKKVTQVATAPIVAPLSIAAKTLDKVGVSDVVKNTVGVDINNLAKTASQTGRLEGSTGSDSFKTALFDSVKVGAAALGGAGAIAGTTAAGTFVLASKAQQGGGVSLGDLGTLAGIPTDIGGIDLGNFNVVKPKTTTPISDLFPDFLSDYVPTSNTNAPSTNYMVIGAVVLGFIAVVYLLVRRLK